MKSLFKRKAFIIPAITGILVGSILLINNLSFENSKTVVDTIAFEEVDTTSEVTTTNTTNEVGKFYVDVKGAVNNPGVYLADETMIVNDLIEQAGGLTSKAYTKNINLAQSVTNGMVIYVFSKSEMTTTSIKSDAVCTTQVINYDACIKDTTTTSTTTKTGTTSTTTKNSIVNINTASKEELMSLSGIGESKALAIIEYRNSNKFNSIEDIMNVSGIGEALFAKIKNNITV